MNYALLPLLTAGDIADTATRGIGGFLAPMVTLVLFLVIGLMIVVAAKRYKKVPQGKALVVYGKGKTRIVTGGAVFIWPLINSYFEMDLTAFQFEIDMKDVPNKERVPLNIKATATCRISDKDTLLQIAAGIFQTKKLTDIQLMIKNILEGHLRVIVGQTTTEEILSERDSFNQKVAKEATGEVNNLGCEILVLNIAEVTDKDGVIEALGKPRIAEVKAEAAIKEAEQLRRQTISVTDAQREAAETEAKNKAEISKAQRAQQKVEQETEAEIAKATATAEQAGPLAKAEAEKGVKVAQVAVEEAETEARTKLQAKIEEKNRAEFKATIITKAEADKEQMLIEADATAAAAVKKADGDARAAIAQADGDAKARNTRAEAERTALAAEGEGEAEKTRKTGLAAAEVTEKTGQAEAAANKAKLEAEAAGQEAMLRAKAAGILAELTAQADGRAKLLDAYKNLTPEQLELVKLQMMYDNLPRLIQEVGGVAKDVMGQISSTVCASMSNVDSITVYDSSAGSGSGALERTANLAPDLLFRIFTTLKASGLLEVVGPLLGKMGFDPTKMGGALGVPAANGTEPAPATATAD